MARMRALAGRRHAPEQGAAGRSEAPPEKAASVEGLLKPVAHGAPFSLLQGICRIAQSNEFLNRPVSPCLIC